MLKWILWGPLAISLVIQIIKSAKKLRLHFVEEISVSAYKVNSDYILPWYYDDGLN